MYMFISFHKIFIIYVCSCIYQCPQDMEQVDHRDQFYCFYIEFNDNLCNGILMLPLAFPVTYQGYERSQRWLQKILYSSKRLFMNSIIFYLGTGKV